MTVGTGAQAQANLIEYKDLRQVASTATKQEMHRWFSRKMIVGGGRSHGLLPLWLLALLTMAVFGIPRRVIQLRGVAEGGKEAERILQLARLVIVWFILFIGALLVLVAASIQLALA